jgi:hypothetical protein
MREAVTCRLCGAAWSPGAVSAQRGSAGRSGRGGASLVSGVVLVVAVVLLGGGADPPGGRRRLPSEFVRWSAVVIHLPSRVYACLIADPLQD